MERDAQIGTAREQTPTPQTECQRREHEILERSARLEQCLMESNHRMKNHLQLLAATLELETDKHEKTLSAEGVVRLQDRLRALGALHDLLAQNGHRQNNREGISARDLLDRLVSLMQNLYTPINIRYQAQEVWVPTRKAMALAVIAQELISNALKHGKGSIGVTLRQHGSEAILEIDDDGPGFASDFEVRKASRMGLTLIEHLAGWDLKGALRYENRFPTGARIGVAFPIRMDDGIAFPALPEGAKQLIMNAANKD